MIRLLNRKNAIIICALTAWFFVPAANVPACAQIPTGDQWLVLTNGQTLQGKVSFADGRYSVVTATGSRIIVAKDKANFVADSIADIYWEKWSRVNPSDGTSHISLFRWCLKNGLMDEAQKQIDLVAKIDKLEDQAGHLSRMAQELELAVEKIEKEALIAQQIQQEKDLEIRSLPQLPTDQKTEFAAAPQIPSAPIDAEGRPVRSLSPSNVTADGPKSQVELVDFEEEVEPETRRSKPAWVNNRQLDRETRSMPDGTVRFYKRHLERKLIANCASCHDSRSVSMPLSKRSFGQTIPRRMSQQNLHFVVEQIDRVTPLNSRLLAMATTAHGDQKSAAFEANDPFVFDLKKWTIAVSNDPAKWLMELQESTMDAKVKESAEDAINEVIVVDPDSEPEKKTQVKEAEVKKEEEAEASDPYDPSAFNRR